MTRTMLVRLLCVVLCVLHALAVDQSDMFEILAMKFLTSDIARRRELLDETRTAWLEHGSKDERYYLKVMREMIKDSTGTWLSDEITRVHKSMIAASRSPNGKEYAESQIQQHILKHFGVHVSDDFITADRIEISEETSGTVSTAAVEIEAMKETARSFPHTQQQQHAQSSGTVEALARHFIWHKPKRGKDKAMTSQAERQAILTRARELFWRHGVDAQLAITGYVLALPCRAICN